MVLDPFSALSLACNIVQFVDFGTRLSASIYELYNSASGLASDQTELLEMADRLQSLAEQLSPADEAEASAVTDSKRFTSLLYSCRLAAQELTNLVEDLKVDKSRKMWSSIRQGIRGARKRGEIERLINRMKTLQDSLNSYLLALLQDSSSKVFAALQDLANEEARMDVEWQLDLRKMKDDILQEIRTQRARSFDFEPISLERNAPPPKPPPMEKKLSLLTSNQLGLEAVASGLSTLASDGMKVSHAQRMLGTLYFPEMQLRQSDIRSAHHLTFDWLYQDSGSDTQSSLASWFQDGEGVYWVAGKAGSGKSTLLNHIVRDPKTLDLLRRWANPDKLFIGSYFFWNSGSALQKSQNGLIRSLLFDVLRICPELIQEIMPDSAVGYVPQSWTLHHLMTAFRRLADVSTHRYRFCFVIDGLDEYDGDHHELVQVLKDAFSSSCMKLCLSSRPWNVFQEAFGQQAGPHMLLENYTRNDILNYVTNTMEQSTAFSDLKSIEPRCSDFIREIVDRAQGVFLWVVLVTRSLVRGFTNADTFDDLERRLHEFPRELGPFFRHMYESIEPFYRLEAARYFQIAMKARRAYRLLTYDLHGAGDAENIIRIYLRGREWGDSSYLVRLQRARKRINARTQGLLEVYGQADTNARVDFFHRTVQDFLCLEDMQRTLSIDLPPEADIDHDLCLTFFAELKCMPEVDHPGSRHTARDTKSSVKISNIGPSFDKRECREIVGNFLYHVRQIEARTRTAPITLIEDFRDTLSECLAIADEDAMFWGTIRSPQYAFLEEATLVGLIHYPAQKFMTDPDCLSDFVRSIVLCRLFFSEQTIIQGKHEVRDVVRRLIQGKYTEDRGINSDMSKLWSPNSVSDVLQTQIPPAGYSSRAHQVTLTTPWQMFLFHTFHQRHVTNSFNSRVSFDLARLLIQAGANPRVLVEVERGKALPAPDIFRTAFSTEESEELCELFEQRILPDRTESASGSEPIAQTATVADERIRSNQSIATWLASWIPFRGSSSMAF